MVATRFSTTSATRAGMVAALSLAACGEDAENNPGGGSGCDETVTVMSGLDEVTPIGLSGADLMALAAGPRSTTMFAEPNFEELIELATHSESTGLAVEVIYEGGEVRFVHSEQRPCAPGGECPDIIEFCPERVEFDVILSLHSQDGLLAESWSTTLFAWDPDDPDADEYGLDAEPGELVVQLNHEIAADTVAGTLELVEVHAPDDAEEIEARLWLTTSYRAGEVMTGRIWAQVSWIDGGVAVGNGASLFRW